MKIKKIALASLAAVAAITVASCSGSNTQEYSGKNWHGSLTSDYTSLANPHANPAIDEEGYYTVGDQKIKTKDIYKTTYTTDIQIEKLNYYKNTWQFNSLQYGNMVDGLIANNQYGELYGDLALGYKIGKNDEGKQTWTFKLKEGVKWVNNSTGAEVAEVKADDFVAGIEYLIDPFNASELTYLVFGVIDGAQEYYESRMDNEVSGNQVLNTENDKPLSTVGIKAIDDYTIEYTLCDEIPYFLTYLTYGCYYPVNRDFLNEQGTDFGASQNNILVNGAFRMTEYQKGSKIILTKNDLYHDVEYVYVNTIQQTYYSRKSTIDTTRKLYENGDTDSFTVQSSDTEGWNKYVVGPNGTGKSTNPYDPSCSAVTSTDQFSFYAFFNYIRTTYEYGTGVTPKTDAEKANTAKAVANKNFRLGFLYGLDVMKYLKFFSQEDPSQRLIRAYTVKELAYDNNNKDYASYVEDVFNQKQGTTGVRLNGTDQGNDPIYNATKAGQYFATAKTELEAQGVTFPIKIDVIGQMDPEQAAYENLMYDALEANSNGVVDIRVNTPADDDQNDEWGAESYNYDFSMFQGWGADYGDPKSFLHTIIEGDGDTINYMGFSGSLTAEQKTLMHNILGAYTEAYKEGEKITDPSKTVERYQKFAEAEYKAIYEEAIIIPWYTRSGIYPVVSKVIPHQASKASYGNNPDKFKNIVVSESVLTKEQRDAINKAYEDGKK